MEVAKSRYNEFKSNYDEFVKSHYNELFNSRYNEFKSRITISSKDKRKWS